MIEIHYKDPEIPKVTPENIHEALLETRGMIEGKIKSDGEKWAQLDKFWEAQETKNQELTTEILARKKAEDEAVERVAVIEAELAKRAGQLGDPVRDEKLEAEYKAFDSWFKGGEKPMTMDMKAQLRTDDDTSAGYLVPEAVDANLLKKITEMDPVRSIASVMTITSKSIEIVVEDSIPTANYEAELEQNQYSEAGYSNVTLTPYRQSFTSRVTQDQLMNSGWPMEQQMSMGAGTAFAKGEGTGFVTGSGHKEPEGFTVNAVVATQDTAGNDAFAPADVLTLWGLPKDGYDLTFVMNRQIMVLIRKFASTTGSYLWTPGLNGPVMNTLCGEPYVLLPAMASAVADGAIIMGIGDFRAGYRIVDRTGMSVIRDDVTEARKANVLITYNRWNTGRVVLPEAIKLLTVQ